ncbi:type I polyketide synthase, partial [Planktotalea sp.]|uniref:type I polyketide synthase n=1 Tax=Planktotalea sp. TaxID=2029877 RepID=UPI003299AD03
MACRLPGGIEDAESCWNFLRDAKDGTTDVPASRWDVDAHYDPDPEVPGRMHTRRGGFLNEDIDQFDASLFSITPREAKTLDPQQRYLLEVSWEALEDAGYAPDSLAGSSTGVFVGISTNDYMGLMHDGMDYRDIDPYCCTGTAGCAAAGRIAYSMGLEGPCLALDTACSSSLVSLHLAMESLRNGECDMALSAGVNMILSPVLNIYFSKLKALAKDGRCKTFDASADGYGRGEGCGVIVLKRLSDAQADGDRILGQLLGSAVNHDGRSGGLTVPSVSAQESVIRSALGKAGLSPADIGYIEAHGTGTPLGDPIEIRALTRIFGPDRPADVPLWVGSVKTNIGHLEAAAGIAGVIKTLLSLQEKTLPAHLHFSQMNPHISHEGLDLRLPQKTQDWPSTVPQVAGVSSFGISGTNAHIVVAGAPDDNVNAASPQAVIERDEHVLTLSARSAASLEEVARRYERDLTVLPPEEFADYCYTSNIGRADFAHRLAISASTPETAITEIKKKAAETADEHVDDGQREKLAMVMARPSQALLTQGRKLYLSEPIFKQAFDACQKAIPADRNVDLPARLLAADPVADEARHKQLELTCCAISIAAARMWIAWGVSPFTLGGEGLSEIAAAHVSGLVGLSDTLELAMHCAALAQASDARDSALEATAKIALRSFAEGLKPRSARFGFASGNTLPKPEFWAQCAMPAHRGRGLDALAAQGCTIALVLGDDGTATALPPQTKPLFGLPSFEKGKGHSVSATAAQLWLKGFAFDWAKYHRGFTRKRVKIAPSPFERRRYWLDKVNQDRRVTQTSDTADTQPRLYQMNWETCPAPTVSQDASETTVLILSESGIGGEELAKHLEGRAARVQSRAFNLPQNDASQTWSELVLLFDETEQGLGDDAQNLCRAQAGLSAKLSAFAQAVEDSGQTPPPRLTIVTKGAYAFQSAPHNWNAVQSALLGLCRVLRNEYPTLRPRLIDCDPSKDFDWLALASEVLIRSEIEDEPESILRAEQRFVARLAPANNATISQQSMAQSLTAEGSYLITGGTGGLGRTVTDWLVQNGARNIILVSRTGETAQLKSHMEGWATQGANVQIARCDIAVQSEVDALLSDIRSGPHGLRGIVHAAGVLDDGLIADMTAERFEAVLAPKVAGLLTLAEASKSDDLDWLVSFSSIAGVLG